MTMISPLVVIAISLGLIINSKTIHGLTGHYQLGKNHLEVPNKSRYAIAMDTRIATPTIEQLIADYVPKFAGNRDASKYQINLKDLTRAQTASTSSYGLLDNEDRDLLDKFYSEVRDDDPFQGDSLVNSKDLWVGKHDEELYTVPVDLFDRAKSKPTDGALGVRGGKTASNIANRRPTTVSHNEWTIDPQLLTISNLSELPAQNSTNQLESADKALSTTNKLASYSPIHRLLTSYDPIEEKIGAAADTRHERGSRGNRVVGATLYGKGRSLKPVVSSKSSKLAVKLHDELLEEPPRDGIARVRMYFHRAIHDDVKLYGTGPWKYWGHGWGVEFGFDPKETSSPNFYQKGYTIERAYGRDFCKDKKNCRPPDPEFFKTVIPRVGIK